jgi:hypothetical protein
MIISSVHNRDARVPIHKQLQDTIAIRSDSSASKSLFDDGGNDGYRLSTADQGIFEFARVHLHEIVQPDSGAAVISRTAAEVQPKILN